MKKGEKEVKLSTGVVLKIKPVPVMAIRAIQQEHEKTRPQVPKVYLEEKAREEYNPNDPAYKAALDDWETELESRLIDFAIAKGTEVGRIPAGFPGHMDDEWVDDLKPWGLPIASNGRERYLDWLKYVAAPTPDDIKAITRATTQTMGVSEEDVAEAAELFQNRAQRRANRKALA